MTTIRLLDARSGLNLKCRELFRDEKIADAIYRCLCDGIEECEDAEPKRKTGKWIRTRTVEHDGELYCDQCGQEHPEQKLIWNYCPNCGADMRTAKCGTKIDLCIMDEVEGLEKNEVIEDGE